MINNRQNGRRRGRIGGAPRPNGGGGAPDRGSRLDNRARGNASQLHEKYKTLAADMQRQGDRVMTEYYLQFADHYFRVLSESRSRFDEQQQQQRGNRFDGQGDTSGDEEEGDDGEMNGDDRFDDRPAERVQQRGQDWNQQERGERDGNRNDGNRNDGRNDRNGADRNESRGDGRNESRGEGRGEHRNDNRGDVRGDGQRQDRNDGYRDGNRSETGRAEGGRNDGGHADRQDRGDEQRTYRQPRDGSRDQPQARDGREQGGREQGGREQGDAREPRQPRTRRGFVERQEGAPTRQQPDASTDYRRDETPREETPPVPAAPATTNQDVTVSIGAAAELPLDAPVVERRPRGRPRKVPLVAETTPPASAAPEQVPARKAATDEADERIEMDRLPPSLSTTAAGAADDEKPRRRTRRPRGETAPIDA